MAQHLYTVFLILASAGFTIAANLTLKLASRDEGIASFWPLSVINGRVMLAAAAFAMAFLFYAMILRRLPLSLAQAILSIQFVLVILAANVLLSEPVGGMRWIGIALMALGLVVIGLAPSPE